MLYETSNIRLRSPYDIGGCSKQGSKMNEVGEITKYDFEYD